MKNKFLAFSAFSGFFCIALGAFAAHGLQNVLESKELAWIQTGIQYQVFHTLALLALGLFQIANQVQNPPACRTKAYSLAFTGVKGFAWSTPIGGIFFMIGWSALFYISVRTRK